jgi:hypothetical protein
MTNITKQESKDQAEGFMAWRQSNKRSEMTKIAASDKRYGDDKYCKRVEIDHAKDQMRDDMADREVRE